MGNILPVVLALIPTFKQYMTKNAGLNTMTGGFIGGFLALAVNDGLSFERVVDLFVNSQGDIDRLITWLQAHGETGLVAGAIVGGLRVGVAIYRAARK